MKKIIFILSIVLMFVLTSCNNDEPEINKNPKDCAITYFEDIILSKNLNYVYPKYCQAEQEHINWLQFHLTDFDEKYYNNYNVYKASLYDDTDLNDFRKKLEEIFKCNIIYDGWWDYATVCYFCKIEHRSFNNSPNSYLAQRFQRFHANILGDEITMITHPNHMYGFLSITINCHHGNHPHPQLKNAEIIY